MKKRTLKRYAGGGSTGAAAGTLSTVANSITPGAGLAIPILDQMNTMTSDEYGAPKSGIAGVINRSNPLANLSRVMEGKDVGRSLLGLSGVGTIAEATGLSKKLFGKSDYELEAEKREFDKNNLELSRRMNTNTNWGNSNINTSTNMMFAKGGTVLTKDDPNANAELELQETFQTPDGTVGNVDSPSHENGGIKVNLPEGTRIWSDKLKHNGKTFAKHTKPITNKIARLEKQIAKNPANSEAKENSIALLNDQLDYYFDTQETNKQNNEMKRTFRKGGLVKYRVGGPFESDEEYVTGYGTPVQNEEVIYDENMFPMGEMPKSLRSTNIYNQNSTVNKNPYRSFYESDANISKGQPLGSTANAGMDNLGFTPETSNSNWFANNKGLVGQLGTAALSAGIQSSRINKLARPRNLSGVRLSDKVVNPNLVDYSAERNAIDRIALNAMSDAQRGFGSSAATQAFKNKARLNQLEGTSRSFQAQSNANTQIRNQFLNARQEAAMKEAMMNNEIDKYNLENVYGFDTMKAGQKNAITAMLANTAGQAFGKQTEYSNQLDQANILANQYDPSVINDMIKNGKLKMVDGKYVRARNGGTIKKRSFKK